MPIRSAVLAAVLALAVAPPAWAVFTGEMSQRAPSGDADYARGIDAFEAEDWAGVIEAMTAVVERRPHHDNAWTRLGYAHRQIGDYEESLDAYGRALSLNPHHRGAMAYLGQAYLELDRLTDAESLLTRLAGECRRVVLGFTDGDFTNGCEEHAELSAAIEAYRGGETGGFYDR